MYFLLVIGLFSVPFQKNYTCYITQPYDINDEMQYNPSNRSVYSTKHTMPVGPMRQDQLGDL